jgi:hypothetical protein
MLGAFAYLAACSIRNRMVVRFRRLREPRYFIGLAVAMAYLGLLMTRPARPRALPGTPIPAFDGVEGLFGVIGAAGLLAATALAWVLPGTGRPALTFSQADVQFLFTAPISRRELLHYKLVRSQGGALVGSALVTVLFRPATLAEGWTFFLGMLLVMMTVNLHLTGVSLRRESLRAHGTAGVVRQWAPLAIVIGAVSVVIASIASHWAVLLEAASVEDFLTALGRVSVWWPVRVVLWPFTTLMQLPLSDSHTAFLATLPFGLAAFSANYLWVLKSDVAFEEAAAADAERQVAERRRGPSFAVPAKRRQPPFVLRPVGRPEMALLWKNLILAGRYASAGMVWRLLPVLALGAFTVSQAARSVADALAAVAVIGAVGTVFVGPQILRNDLRQDLTQIATLKMWPLSGSAIVRGEVLAPTVILTSIVGLLLVAAALLWGSVTFQIQLSGAERAVYACAGLSVSAAIILLEIVVQNALVVLFPAWTDLGATSGRGMEVMGQRILVAGVLVLSVAVALVPAVIAALASAWAWFLVTGLRSVALPVFVATAALVAQSAIVIALLGRTIDRMDVSAVPAAD